MATKTRGSTQRATVTFRYANGAAMAKKKNAKKNPKRSHRRHGKHNPKRSHRRRNPGGRKMTFGTALGHALAGAAVMFASGVIVTVATAKIKPGSPWSLYGIPTVTGLAGAAIATKYPLIGVGVAAGAAAPFVLPTGAKVIADLPASSQTTSGARQLAAATQRAMRSVQLGRVKMGVVQLGDCDDDDDA